MTLAIIIPTKNRHEFLIRQLAYYAEVGCNHTIFVGDLSDDQHVEITHSAVSKFEDQTEIKYLSLPGLTEFEAIQELAQRVDQSYVALASDDDFLIPGTLQDCADFLDLNSEFGTAHGLPLSFAVGLDQACGEFVRTGQDPHRPAEDTNGRLRLLTFLSSHWPAQFCVQRTDSFMDAAVLASQPEDKTFKELLASCVSIIRGKSKGLDRLYSLRQAHIQFAPLPYGFDWVTETDWLASYSIFRSCLKEELARQDGIGMDEAEEVFKEAFRSYMAWRLARGRTAPLRSLTPTPKRRWREASGAIPGVRSMWQQGRRLGKAIRSMNPPEPDKFSLSALLRPSSPYHADFMPVYRAVAMPAE